MRAATLGLALSLFACGGAAHPQTTPVTVAAEPVVAHGPQDFYPASTFATVRVDFAALRSTPYFDWAERAVEARRRAQDAEEDAMLRREFELEVRLWDMFMHTEWMELVVGTGPDGEPDATWLVAHGDYPVEYVRESFELLARFEHMPVWEEGRTLSPEELAHPPTGYTVELRDGIRLVYAFDHPFVWFPDGTLMFAGFSANDPVAAVRQDRLSRPRLVDDPRWEGGFAALGVEEPLVRARMVLDASVRRRMEAMLSRMLPSRELPIEQGHLLLSLRAGMELAANIEMDADDAALVFAAQLREMVGELLREAEEFVPDLPSAEEMVSVEGRVIHLRVHAPHGSLEQAWHTIERTLGVADDAVPHAEPAAVEAGPP